MAPLGGNGGLIGTRRVPSFSSASGVWTLDEQVIARRAGIWPTQAANRYWRMDGWATTALNTDTFDATEIQFFENGTLITGITCTSNGTFALGNAAIWTDGTINEANRGTFFNWSTQRATTRIDFDMGSVRLVTAIRIRGLYTQPRFPASFNLSSSATNGSGYSLVATVTVGTSFTAEGGNVFSSGTVSVP